MLPPSCKPCELLGTIRELQRIEERAITEAPDPNLKNSFLTPIQWGEKLKRQKKSSSLQRLKEWHMSKKLHRIQSARDTHQKIIELLAQNRVAC